MPNNFWQKIDEIFPQVADLPEAERDDAVRALCGGDEALRREILALLAADRKAADFCETPPLISASLTDSLAKAADQLTADPNIGKRLGAYRLREKIGSGGMGAVYLATRDDGAFRKKVAVKLLRRGFETDFHVRRFRHERQVLAALEHPFIARLIDGGVTADGLPYFVIEHVEGKTLFDFCGSQRLDLIARLKLFRQICAAVASAHEKGVVHRDLKPGNILVTPYAAVKLLDFGIAKILDERLIDEPVTQTETLLRQMTPEYASPEQIKGERVSPASDIYSLGVLLYELTTGARPYKFPSRAPHEIARVVCEEMPPAPEFQFDVQRADDLKFIIFKSMHKNPAERFASVDELAAAVDRLMEGAPAASEEARRDLDEKLPASEAQTAAVAGTRLTEKIPLRRFAARSLMMPAFLIVAVIVTALGFYSVRQKRDAAFTAPDSSSTNEKSRSKDAVAEDFYRAGKRQMAARTLDGVNKAIEFFNEAARRDPDFALAFSSLADAHILLGRWQPNGTDYRRAEEYAMKAIALDPDLAEARVSLGMAIYRNGGNFELAAKHFRRAVEIDPQLAAAHHWYAIALDEQGQRDAALREIESAAAIEPGSAVIQHTVASMYMRAGRYDEAMTHFDRAIANDNTFVAAYHWKSLLEQYQGKYDSALETYSKARIYSGKDNSEPLWRLMNAEAHAASGRVPQSQQILQDFFQSEEFKRAPADFATEIALVYHLSGDDDKAFAWLEKVKLANAEQVKTLVADPRFARLHADERFSALTERWEAKN